MVVCGRFQPKSDLPVFEANALDAVIVSGILATLVAEYEPKVADSRPETTAQVCCPALIANTLSTPAPQSATRALLRAPIVSGIGVVGQFDFTSAPEGNVIL